MTAVTVGTSPSTSTSLARTVIVTAERLRDTAAFRAEPARTTYPGYAVDHVVDAPLGAYPTASYPRHGYDGAFVRDVELPGIGSADGFGGKRTDTETFYTFSSFATPPSTYRYDLVTGSRSATPGSQKSEMVGTSV